MALSNLVGPFYDNDPNHIYYNLNCVSNRVGDPGGAGQGPDPPIAFQETRSSPILRDASKYYMSIIRFSMLGPSLSLPVIIPQAQIGQSDPKQLVYSVTLSATFKGAFNAPPTPSYTVVAGVNDTFAIGGNQVTPVRKICTIAPGTYASTAALAAAVQTAVQTGAPGGGLIATTTVADGGNGQLLWNCPQATGTTTSDKYAFVYQGYLQAGIPQAVHAATLQLLGIDNVFGSFWNIYNYTALTPAGKLSDFPSLLDGQTIYTSPTFVAQNFLYFVPDNKDEIVALPPLLQQDLTSKYYYIYSYNSMVDMFNSSAQWCLDDSNDPRNATPGVPSANCILGQFKTWYTAQGYAQAFPGITTEAPILQFNSTNQTFTWLMDTYGFGGVNRLSADNFSPQSGIDEEFYLYENSNSWGLLPNFETNFYKNDNTLGQVYEIVAKPYGANNNIVVPINIQTGQPNNDINAPTYWAMTQDSGGTTNLWSPISSLVFVTTLLPSVSEQVSAPILFTNQGNNSSQTVQSAFLNQITDIELPIASPSDWRDGIFYAPTAEYRLVDLGSSPVPIQDIDVKVFWKAKLNQQLYAVEMFNLSTVSMKILFRRKTA